MRILIMRVTLRASWSHSLKEKRMVVRSIVQKLKNKFNISVAEVDNRDIHQSIVIGISAVCGDIGKVDSTMESIIDFIERNTDAEIIDIEKDDIVK
ncbi:DUF503 domain-containing protein [Clostridium felsineum]|uniref:DUF503 domain-containing protein n=1 Tax=Clostridium felsineum TaxID=36839 RepID=UPI00098CA7CE|nr:DUF503 domain-containing protein [Clostridium felsineum]MCR3759442.1 DUF503 domain-containing protein [Clostridium felsineum]URZ01644.1 hypothetical protein CLAUR_016390 [Clostridium felsineum]